MISVEIHRPGDHPFWPELQARDSRTGIHTEPTAQQLHDQVAVTHYRILNITLHLDFHYLYTRKSKFYKYCIAKRPIWYYKVLAHTLYQLCEQAEGWKRSRQRCAPDGRGRASRTRTRAPERVGRQELRRRPRRDTRPLLRARPRRARRRACAPQGERRLRSGRLTCPRSRARQPRARRRARGRARRWRSVGRSRPSRSSRERAGADS